MEASVGAASYTVDLVLQALIWTVSGELPPAHLVRPDVDRDGEQVEQQDVNMLKRGKKTGREDARKAAETARQEWERAVTQMWIGRSRLFPCLHAVCRACGDESMLEFCPLCRTAAPTDARLQQVDFRF